MPLVFVSVFCSWSSTKCTIDSSLTLCSLPNLLMKWKRSLNVALRLASSFLTQVLKFLTQVFKNFCREFCRNKSYVFVSLFKLFNSELNFTDNFLLIVLQSSLVLLSQYCRKERFPFWDADLECSTNAFRLC